MYGPEDYCRAVNREIELFFSDDGLSGSQKASELLGSVPDAAKAKPGPQSQLQRKFEQVKLLPREKQEFVLQFLDTILESSRQKQKA